MSVSARPISTAGVSSAPGWSGLQAVERAASLLAFRMDDRKQRIVIDRSMPDGGRFFGWEVADAAALDALAARLEAAGIAVTAEPQTLADNRRVRGLISFHDPAGNRLEAFHGAEIADTPFSPGRSISGFRTGPLGVGHVVLTVDNIDPMMAFYVDVLGFALSDYIEKPFRAYFFHINARHHSLALIETGKNGMHHLMVELFSLDDVGQAYDVASSEPERVNVTLGRHTNDLMTSFYAKTPSSFMVECGWGGRDIEPKTWKPFEMKAGPSLWGHERVWLPPADREVAREMRMKAAADGMRAPVQVMDGNYKLLGGDLPVVGWGQRQGIAAFVIAGEAKQSRAEKERLDCFARSLPTGAHSRAPLAPRNDERGSTPDAS